jgi:hypothetical protein
VFRKYLPYILLIAAACLFYWIKNNQGNKHTPARAEIEAYPQFNRDLSTLKYSKHAKCRMDCRHIDESEVKEILKNGSLKYERIEKNDKGYTYPLEGYTHDHQHVRIVFAPHEDTLVVVTVIDLGQEWECNCN